MKKKQESRSEHKAGMEYQVSAQARAFANFIKNKSPMISETFLRLATRTEAVANGTKEEKYNFYLSFGDHFKDGQGSLRDVGFTREELLELDKLERVVNSALDLYYPDKWK